MGGVFGALASLFSAVKTEENGFVTLFITSLVMELVVQVLLGWNIYERFRHKNKEKELNEKLKEANKRCEEIRAEVDEEKKKLDKERSGIDRLLSDISLSIKNNSIHNNTLLVKIPAVGDESYQYSDIITGTEKLTEDEKRKYLIQDADRYANELFDIFKRYCATLLAQVVKLEKSYVAISGYEIKMSATIKLLDKTYVHGVDRRTEVKVYTAFRDKDTYEDKNDHGMPKREIGQKLYSIDGNVDFDTCLTKEFYIINNASRNLSNYRNEHEGFDDFYNCAIIVPIRVTLANGSKMFFGFLCCDCLNENYEGEEIFDKGAAQYLFAFAQNFATFIETLDANWQDRFSDEAVEGISKSIIEMVFQKTFHPG